MAQMRSLAGGVLRRLRDRRARSELFWSGVAMGLQLSAQLALVKLLTGRLTPAEYGVLGLFNAGTQLCEQTLFVPFLQGANRLAPTGEAGQIRLNPFRAAVSFWLRLGGWIVVGAVLLAGFCFWAGKVEYGWLSLMLSVIMAVELRREYWAGLAFMGRFRKVWAAVYGSDHWGRWLLCLAALAVLPRSALTVVCMFVVSSLLAGTIARRRMGVHLPSFARKGEHVQDADLRHQLLQFSLPWGAISGFVWGQRFGDRWAVGTLMSTFYAGLYVGATQLGSVIFNTLSGLIITFSSPILYHEVARGNLMGSMHRTRRLLRMIYAGYWAIGIAGLGLLAIFCLPAVRLLLGPQYLSVVPLVLVIAMGSLVLNASQLQVLSVMVTGHTDCLLMPEVISGIAAVALDIVLVSEFGLRGAAWGLLITASLRTGLMAVATRRAWKKPPLQLQMQSLGNQYVEAADC